MGSSFLGSFFRMGAEREAEGAPALQAPSRVLKKNEGFGFKKARTNPRQTAVMLTAAARWAPCKLDVH